MNEQGHFEVLVVGAGPAGLAAACVASESGLRVGVVDDNPDVGGQIWRAEKKKPSSKEARRWLGRLNNASITFLSGSQVIDQQAPQRLVVLRENQRTTLHYQKLILATGARELFLPFPGWTLPGVMGAGGLQAMVKSGMPIEGKRVIVAGSGPLLLAVAAYLRVRGARISTILEQAPWKRLARFGVSLLLTPSKIIQFIGLRSKLQGAAYQRGHWPIRAEGERSLRSVTFTNGQRTWNQPCDYLACGFGLIPNLELPLLLGCELSEGSVQVGDLQQSSIENVHCVGEITGIGGLDLSLVEGEIAGLAVANRMREASKLFAKRQRARAFARRLREAFVLRPELLRLAEASTFVCRCEDVSFERLQRYGNWREAKLQTRCGMGPCQGRICGAITEQLFGWGMESVRPPLFPSPVSTLMSAEDTTSEL